MIIAILMLLVAASPHPMFAPALHCAHRQCAVELRPTARLYVTVVDQEHLAGEVFRDSDGNYWIERDAKVLPRLVDGWFNRLGIRSPHKLVEIGMRLPRSPIGLLVAPCGSPPCYVPPKWKAVDGHFGGQ